MGFEWKLSRNEGFKENHGFLWSIFQQTMFDYPLGNGKTHGKILGQSRKIMEEGYEDPLS